jgi:uncharacterized protein YdaU (DUF1376 family)
MKYYSHHIGDFDKATRHLTRLERSIYRDLIELYYDTEQQLPLDINWICRRIIARSNEEVTAVEQALNEFFTKTPNGWYHDRCEEELEAFRSSTSQKSIAGKASAAKRAIKRQQALNGISTDVEQTLNERGTASQLTNNHKPLTINHIEKENNKKKKGIVVEVNFYGVPEKIVNDFKSHRKSKKAPITQTAIDRIRKEADKAGIDLAEALAYCCSRGWVGFEASWILKEQPRARGSPYQSSNEKAKEWAERLTGTKNEQPQDIIDIN